MGEILLGGRRTGRARKWLRTLLIAVSLLIVAVIIALVSFRRATTYDAPVAGGVGGAMVADGPRLLLDGASLERVGKLWVLRASGTPWQLGVARGRLLGARAARASLALDATLVGEHEPDAMLARFTRRARLRWKLRLLADGLARERRDELGGLAAGLTRDGASDAPSYQQLVRRQAALDLGAAPGGALPQGGVASAFAFATAGVGNDNGRLLVGRAFALPGAPGAGAPTVSFIRPEGGLAFATIGWSDQVGAVTGVNAEGIAVALAPSVAGDVRATAARAPLALIARDVLERAHDLDEAIAIVEDTIPLGAGSFLLVDGETRSFAVVERSPSRVAVRRSRKDEGRHAPLVVTDVLVAPEFAKDAENARAYRLHGRAARDTRLSLLVNRPGAAELATVIALLRDHRRDADHDLPPGHPGAIDDLAAQHVVVIDPVGLLLWVGDGPGAAGRFHTFDLRAELRGEPPRAWGADEAVVPAAVDVDAGRLEHTLLARAALELALALERGGQRRAAAEAAERALALAPALPEPWRVAARLARASGDRDRARVLYRTYLDLLPASPAGLEEANAFMSGP